MAVFLANIGVNAGHTARSPLFRDGSFTVIPIPERMKWRAPMLRLKDLPEIAEHAPESLARIAVHLDPDFIGPVPTYGDNCRRAARAYALRKAVAGDRIVFLARLHPRSAPPAFYLVGELVVDEILADVVADPGPGWWDGNAHLRRARATGAWDSFWVFRGGPGSGFYPQARPFRREEVENLFSEPWLWRPNRSELQTIGSYTRTIRRLPGAE
jgi:Nucleotide modification associated domain 3